MSWDSMRFRDFKEDEWHTFWGMLSAAVADIPDVVKGITDLGSKCSALIGTVDAGIELWQIVSAHNKFHDTVKRKIYQHVPEALGDSVNVIAKAIFKYLSQLKNSDKNIAYYYQNKKDEDFAHELFEVCVHSLPTNIVPEPELRFFLGEVAKIILDPENAVLLTEDEEILKGLLTSVRNLNEDLAQVQDAQHALKGEMRRSREDYSELAVEVYELSDRADCIELKLNQHDEDVNVLKEDIADLKRASSPSETKQLDNKEYLDLYEAPLFLDSDNVNISIKNLYVSPKVQDSHADIELIIWEWFGNRYVPPCLLLYGAAGIGKTSLVAKLIADAEEKRKTDSNAAEVLAVMLRKHTDIMEKAETGEQILAELFGAQNALDDKLLILDGLDEACVLKQEFDGAEFLRLLSDVADGYHIIVTSRGSVSKNDESCYFKHPSELDGLCTKQLCWTETEVAKWCEYFEKYETDQEIKDWCRTFPEKYNKFEENDQRREIFCVPFILYLCCKDRVDPDQYDKVGDIYDKVFRSVLLRDHIRRQGHKGGFTKQDLRSNLIAWQYAKEIAYQMFLTGVLDLSEEQHAEQLEHAKNRTITLVNQRIKEINQETGDENKKIRSITEKDQFRLKFLAVFHFAKESSDGKGIAFVHKTVYQYFTAVKLYEDYFAQFDSLFFQKKKPQTKAAAKVIAESYIEAFRYKGIPKEIFAYLNSMQKPPFSGSDKVSAGGFDAEHFLQAYVYGMKTDILSEMAVKKPMPEYNYQSDPVSMQFNRAFQNFTWFLTGHGFKNSDDVKECKNIRDLLTIADTEVCLAEWNLSGAHLRRANLGFADMRNADLRAANLTDAYLDDAKLSGANLRLADLSGANLSGADLSSTDLEFVQLPLVDLSGIDLSSADLSGADLSSADLSGADLSGADLSGVDLSDADLSGAQYCKDTNLITIFPDDFTPEEHGMIEVDKDGNPVKK